MRICSSFEAQAMIANVSLASTLPESMSAMRLTRAGAPLSLTELPIPTPGAEQVLLRVSACGVCRTDLHLLDGELPSSR
jgi:propanol-preferring alcohol dehydrogenase